MSDIDTIAQLRAEFEERIQSLMKTLPTPAYPKRTEKTKLKWILDSDNYRVAIVLADGVLQVKTAVYKRGADYRTDFSVSLEKTLFADEAAWRASLPAGGEVIITPFQAPLDKKMVPLKFADDPEKLKELMERFKIPTTNVYARAASKRMLRISIEHLDNAIKNEPKNINWAKSAVAYWGKLCASQTEEQKNYEPSCAMRHGKKQRIFLIVGDEIKEVAFEDYHGVPYIVDYSGNRYKTFADIGDCLNAKWQPRLSVMYRNKTFSVANLF